MSALMPAFAKASVSAGLSAFSQRAADLVSGRMTPTEPLAAADDAAELAADDDADEAPPVAAVELELLLQALRDSAKTAARPTAAIRRLVTSTLPPREKTHTCVAPDDATSERS